MSGTIAQIAAVPSKLNGYPVIKFEAHRNGYATVMVAKFADEQQPVQATEYIVATWWADLGTTWSWGHYFPVFNRGEEQARAEADRAFFEARTRNEAR